MITFLWGTVVGSVIISALVSVVANYYGNDEARAWMMLQSVVWLLTILLAAMSLLLTIVTAAGYDGDANWVKYQTPTPTLIDR